MRSKNRKHVQTWKEFPEGNFVLNVILKGH